MRPFRPVVIVLVFSLAAGPLAAARTRPRRPRPDTSGYYFLLARHLESTKKLDEAIAALKKAIELCARSAELRAELAGLYARQDRARKRSRPRKPRCSAIPDNHEANRILGSVYAALSEQRQAVPSRRRPGAVPAPGDRRAREEPARRRASTSTSS